MEKLIAAKNALVERLRAVDKDSCIDGKFNFISSSEAIEIFKDNGVEKNNRYVFPLSNCHGYAAIFDDYFIITARTIKEYKDRYLVYLFIGNMNTQQHHQRIGILQDLIFNDSVRYAGGYIGMLDFLGFYDFEPVTVGKDGKIRKVLRCMPIQNLLISKNIQILGLSEII